MSFVSVTIPVYGMTCVNCTNAVEKALATVPGVQSAVCSLEKQSVTITYDANRQRKDSLIEAIEDSGFDTVAPDVHASLLDQENQVSFATNIASCATSTSIKDPSSTDLVSVKAAKMTTTIITIQGMTCGSCTAAIESQVNPDKVAGLATFSVSLMSEQAAATHDTSSLSAADIVELIEDCGFDAQVVSSEIALAQVDLMDTERTENMTVKIFGMSCASCVTKIESALDKIPGIESALVNLSLEEARVIYRPVQIGLRNIVEAIQSLGFDALLANHDDNAAQIESLARTKDTQAWRATFWQALMLTIPVFCLNKILTHVAWGEAIFDLTLIIPGLRLGDIASLLLTIPVQFGIGQRFYRTAYNSLKHGSATMDVLVCLGTSAAFSFSILSMLVAIISAEHPKAATFFDTSGMLLTFVSFGRYLENRAKGATSAALSRLMSLAPSSATIYQDAEKATERTIPTELIQVGDIVLLRPGVKIPADGVVIAGNSYVDESLVTGEVKPLYKQKGDLVVAGTVNGRGRLDFSVQRTGRDTQLAQIVKLVQEAQTTKAPIQRFSDIVAGYFVPTVIALGLLTFFIWMILSHVLHNPPMIFLHGDAGGKTMTCLKLCISVIVVACPCALGLATPTAVMVGTGMAATHGVLIKGGAVLETATKVSKVVFDKTGTLTFGHMTVHDSAITVSWRSKYTDRVWWTLIGSAEQHSEHPTGKAIVDKAKMILQLSEPESIPANVQEFEAVIGLGIKCLIELPEEPKVTFNILVGNASFLEQHNISIDFDANILAEHQAHGRTCIFVAINGSFAGMLALADQIKPDVAKTIQALLRMGKDVAMVTGDQLPTALRVAEQAGIPPYNVWAAINPGGKKSIIQQMQQDGDVVAMVGDGINDSPALAVADIGIAMSSGTDVAIEAADIVLMRHGATLDVPMAFLLSDAIFSRIKLNLLWACLYNLVAIPFAMGFFLPFGLHLHPMIAGGAMAMSSVSVVCSSLLLRYWQRPAWLEDQTIAQPKKTASMGFASLYHLFDRGYSRIHDEEMKRMPVQ